MAALLVLYFVWGSTYLAIRVALESLPPFGMAGARFLLAGALMLGFGRMVKQPWPTGRQWLHSAMLGALLLLIGNGGVVFAEKTVDSGLTAVVIATVSLWAGLFGWFFGTRPTLRQWLGIGVGLVGVAVLNFDAGLRGSPLASAVLVLASMSWAFGSAWSRTLRLPTGAMASGAQMLCGGVLMAGVSLALGETWSAAPTGRSLLAAGYLVVAGSLVGFSAYQFLLRRTSPAVATSYGYVNPIVAVLLGALVADEKVGAHALVALVLILLGVALVAVRWPRRSAGPAGER